MTFGKQRCIIKKKHRLPLVPRTPYSEHLEKEIVISDFDYHSGGVRGASYHYIVTTDGEIYNVTGEYSAPELREHLKKGTQIAIKYTENKFFNQMEGYSIDSGKFHTITINPIFTRHSISIDVISGGVVKLQMIT